MIASVLFTGLIVRAEEVSVADFPSIQAALDAHPGEQLHLPAGTYEIDRKLVLRGDHAGLTGPGHIIQTNPDQPIIEIENALDIQITGLRLSRPSDANETDAPGIVAIECRDLVIENVQIHDNRTRAGVITLQSCQDARISRCVIRNYMRVTVDDRTHSDDWGYAFNCTDGTGITVNNCTGSLIESNRIVEENLVPTPAIRDQYQLGTLIKRNPVKGAITNQQVWDSGYTDNWQQGSALVVTGPEVSNFTRIIGNHIENAAQGIDLHADHVTVSQNMVINSFVGMKAMHGSQNVLIIGNQFARNSLWAIGLMPGAAAHAENTDGGSIVANNIISEFGYGDAHWIWGDERSPLRFDTGQQPDDPPLTDVVVQGNIIQAIGTPRYAYAVIVPNGENAPRGLRFENNIFHPGTNGIANRDLAP